MTRKLFLLGTPYLQAEVKTYFLPDQRYELLSYLACAGNRVSRETLSYLFWPDTLSSHAYRNLRRVLHRIKELNPIEGLEITPRDLYWSVETDVAAFKDAYQQAQWEKALHLYQGPLLAGFKTQLENEFYSWLELERSHLHNMWRKAVIEHAHSLEQQKPPEAALWLSKLLEHDPLDEEALAHLMQVYLRADKHEQAKHLFKTYTQTLQRELNLAPNPDLARLLEQGPRPQKPLEKRLAHLPEPATSFVGRDLELAELEEQLANPACRCLSLVGLGGTGKTRLALELAKRQVGFSQVAFVALEQLQQARDIPFMLTQTVGLNTQEDIEEVKRFLKDKSWLIIFDNFEHVLQGAVWVADLLHHCTKLKILVTSRERLNIAGEWLFRVEGLSYPEQPEAGNLYFDAVKLFTERAQRNTPGFQLSEQDMPPLLDICQLVQGSPLALELAASWSHMLSIDEIAQEIQASLDFLSSTQRDSPERHSSLRAVFESSWQQLSPIQASLFQNLAVFDGSFSLEAARYVTQSSLSVLRSLVDKSLLQITEAGRYDWHPLLSYYALEKHQQNPSKTELEKRHAQYYLNLAETAQASTQQWLETLKLEYPQLRASLNWAIHTASSHLGLRLALALHPFWETCGPYTDATYFLQQLLDKTPESLLHTRALVSLATFEKSLGHYSKAEQLLQKALQEANSLTDLSLRVTTLNGLGELAREQNNHAQAKRHLEESIHVCRNLNDASLLAESLGQLAITLIIEKEFLAAKPLLEESLDLLIKQNDRLNIAATLSTLGVVARGLGDLKLARNYHQQSLTMSQKLGNPRDSAATLVHLGIVAFEDDYPSARAYFSEALHIFAHLREPFAIAWSLMVLINHEWKARHYQSGFILAGALERFIQHNEFKIPESNQKTYDENQQAALKTLGETAEHYKMQGRLMDLEQVLGFVASWTTQSNKPLANVSSDQ